MSDIDDFFEMLPARLYYPDRTVDAEVAALVAHVPDEFARPTAGGGYDRFRLRGTGDDGTVEYEYVETVNRSGNTESD